MVITLILTLVIFVTCLWFLVPRERLASPIPKHVYQTHKSQDYVDSVPELASAQASWRNSGYDYSFFDNAACEAFIRKHFDERTVKAYLALPLAVMKADFWRYAVIYVHGGIYADADCILTGDIADVTPGNESLVIAPEVEHYYVCQWVFAATARHPALATVMKRVVERIEQGIDMSNPSIVHDVTGPAIWTLGLRDYLASIGVVAPQNVHSWGSSHGIRMLPHSFHRDTVVHMGAGGWEGGWKSESNYYEWKPE